LLGKDVDERRGYRDRPADLTLLALREGALLAAAYQSTVYLLVIDRETPGTRIADGRRQGS
jgi:hypothetical protein